MGEYIIRRLVGMVPVLFIVSVISFGLLYVLPGDPAIAMLGEEVGNSESYDRLRQELSLNDPVWVQYVKWLGRLVQGDLGTSIRTGEPVAQILWEQAPISVYVGVAGMLVGIAIGLLAAILSAIRPGSRLDLAATAIRSIGSAIGASRQHALTSALRTETSEGVRKFGSVLPPFASRFEPDSPLAILSLPAERVS